MKNREGDNKGMKKESLRSKDENKKERESGCLLIQTEKGKDPSQKIQWEIKRTIMLTRV